jgi:hypothetical protein
VPALAAVGFLSLPPEVTSRTAATARAPSATSAITTMLRRPGAERDGAGASGGGAAGGGATGCADGCVGCAAGGSDAPDGGADAGVEDAVPAHDSAAAGIGVGGGVIAGGAAAPEADRRRHGAAAALGLLLSAIASRAAVAISPAVA